VRAISVFRIDSELRLLFGRIMTGDEHRESQQFDNRIFAIPLDKSGLTRLTPNGSSHHYSNPSRPKKIGWSKDQPKWKNRKILFDCRRESGSSEACRFVRYCPNGRGFRDLADETITTLGEGFDQVWAVSGIADGFARRLTAA
jgi:hypothetical protein